MNGFKIEWGKETSASGSGTKTVTFPVAFSQIPSVASVPHENGGSGMPYNTCGYSVTTTNLKVERWGAVFHWIAIGY